jgi:predicted ATPase
LPKILKRILEDENKKSIITTKLKTFIPELDRIEVKQNDLTGQNDLQVYFKNYEKQPFVGNLISEGTYNIIAILTLIYQSDEPQFLCIEEPENGLHPRVIKLLINFFRTVCENKKHYIWITSHSQTLVSEIMPEEIILVDKQNGKTIINQFQNDTTLIQQYKNKEITMDEAWLCNYLENWTTNEEE